MNSRYLLGFIALFATPSFARIGETLPECIQRYGKPVPAAAYEVERLAFSTSVTAFKKDGVLVFVSFFDGKVDRIAFTKDFREAAEFDLTDEVVAALLKANSGGMEWRPVNDRYSDHAYEWQTVNGSRFASHHAGALIVETLGSRTRMRAKAEAAKKKKEGANKMKGF